jgi:hypothetical protein
MRQARIKQSLPWLKTGLIVSPTQNLAIKPLSPLSVSPTGKIGQGMWLDCPKIHPGDQALKKWGNLPEVAIPNTAYKVVYQVSPFFLAHSSPRCTSCQAWGLCLDLAKRNLVSVSAQIFLRFAN